MGTAPIRLRLSFRNDEVSEPQTRFRDWGRLMADAYLHTVCAVAAEQGI